MNLDVRKAKFNKENILTIIFIVLTLLWTAFLILHSSFNGLKSANESNNVGKIVEDIVNTIAPETITDANREAFNYTVRKIIGHFLSFTLLGTFASLSTIFKANFLNYKNVICVILYGGLIAYLTEIIQLESDGRYGSAKDVLIDFSGYILGIFIVYLIFIIINVVKNKQNSKLCKAN